MSTFRPLRAFRVDRLNVEIYRTDVELGAAAADFVADTLNAALEKQGNANLILATGASQFTFFDALKSKKLDWSRITVFHLDEYLGMSDQHPASFRKYLRERILDAVKPHKIHFLHGDAGDIDSEIERYENLLKSHVIDLACIGIGENGHIAFNDPPVADFHDPRLVKVVTLDQACRQQQLGEGWFASLQEVPGYALTLTIPAIMNSRVISCVVPDARKSVAVHDTLFGPVATHCPASILRRHTNATLFIDLASAGKIDGPG
ncbi:glucosamine-6-phosphate deaminase [candidate division KSB1 bacterium]|nr:glucosamine-6-phosphate deaminase [candidate division KSB1 bacterium]